MGGGRGPQKKNKEHKLIVISIRLAKSFVSKRDRYILGAKATALHACIAAIQLLCVLAAVGQDTAPLSLVVEEGDSVHIYIGVFCKKKMSREKRHGSLNNVNFVKSTFSSKRRGDTNLKV